MDVEVNVDLSDVQIGSAPEHGDLSIRNKTLTGTDSGTVIVEAGQFSDGSSVGKTRVNVNMYATSAGNQKVNASKNGYFIEIDQSDTNDSFRLSRNSTVDYNMLELTDNDLTIGEKVFLNSTALRPVGYGFDLGTAFVYYNNIYVYNAVTVVSDRTQKKSIIDLDMGLNLIEKLKPKKYKMRQNTSNRFHYGLIAQDVEATLVNDFGDTNLQNSAIVVKESVEEPVMLTNSDGELVDSGTTQTVTKYALRYEELVPSLIKAVQELSQTVREQASQLEELKLRVEDLER
jgi:hypothetical protein